MASYNNTIKLHEQHKLKQEADKILEIYKQFYITLRMMMHQFYSQIVNDKYELTYQDLKEVKIKELIFTFKWDIMLYKTDNAYMKTYCDRIFMHSILIYSTFLNNICNIFKLFKNQSLTKTS